VSRRRLTIAIVGMIVAVAGIVVLRNFVYIPLGDDGTAAIHDPASLPARIHVCGRDWTRDALDRRFTKANIDEFGAPPRGVDLRLFAPCPSGVCNATAPGPCATVIFVRVGEDAYLDYSLVGGP
jgi:hypothetical protein